MKKCIFVIILITVCTVVYAQTLFSIGFTEYNDGCLVLENRQHFSGSMHRNDNNYINQEIRRFWNLVNQYYAISVDQQRAGARSQYVYSIITTSFWDGRASATGYTYQIFNVR